MENILEKIKELLVNINYDSDIVITEKTRLIDIPMWDELDTVDLCMAIEDEFDIEINDEEYDYLDTIGNIINLIESKIK